MDTANYADVLLPVPLEGAFTYAIPCDMFPDLMVGCRVVVPFGARKLMTGIVTEIHQRKPDSVNIKQLRTRLDQQPLIGQEQFCFWKWIASYYCCSMGEVMNAALPAGLRPEGDVLETRTGMHVRTQTYVRLAPAYNQDLDALNQVFDKLVRAKKQVALLLKYLELSGVCQEQATIAEVSRRELLDQSEASAVILKGLCTKGILDVYEKEEPDQHADTPVSGPAALNPYQEKALQSIKEQFEKQPVCLLHGYTSSGKTEIYMHLIKECLDQGKQALLLVPEIALTTQLAERLRRVFGSDLGVYHSGISDYERENIWYQMHQQKRYKVILGVRSSIFLPFHSLGMVVVDEEHETSYKQQDPAPRYHARNAAMVLAAQFGAKTLLGTATPSIETYALCLMGKYGLTKLFYRYAAASLPDIVAVDIGELKRRKRMKSIFSPLLLEEIQRALDAGEQVILFQNRRGFAPVLTCKVCGWIPKCSRCDVSLTYHKYHGKLNCHYCGSEYEVPVCCPSCGEPNPVTAGFGTEQVEEEVRTFFPKARTARLDTDTTRNKNDCARILEQFQTGKTNVLIGTQMISKGLDFSHVKVVGILNADQLLGYPDFRAHERAYQLMAQVSGRGGRSGRAGLVIIQTSQPDSSVIQHVIGNDYNAFFNEEMRFRKLFDYPPYTRIIHILFRHRDAALVRQAALYYAGLCQHQFGKRILGPDQPPVSRVRNQHLQSLLLKLEISLSVNDAKTILCANRDVSRNHPSFKSVQIVFDIDPV